MNSQGDFLDRVEAILDEVSAAPADKRDALLRERCGDDEKLIREVESMLRAEAQMDAGFLNRSFASDLQTVPLLHAKRIGPWTVDEPIGAGGMGAVYRGHRADGAFEAEVAIKFIGAGMFDPKRRSDHKRFLRERQILATLDHPNIARLLDGGVTDDGQPYFVMEYVRGESLINYCDEQRATILVRLALFDDICVAVQHAHGNLIVHRDLKPSNILVDEAGRPRLLDFGIASILNNADDPGTITATADRRFTAQYAAPEQVRSEPVTVATDVYALGVILYELLAGARPYDVTSGYTPQDARTICETDPPRPSRRLDASDGDPTTDASSIARARGMEPASLRRSLNGDLDHIVMTALRKEPSRRYATVEALREDLQRYRRGLPVAARPDSWGYRTRKFITRHRIPVTAAAVLSVVLIAAVIVTSWQATIAAEQRRTAESALATSDTVGRFLRSILVAADPREAGQTVTMRDALDQAATRIEEELGDSPAVEARVREAIGMTYRTLGEHEQADVHLTEAHELAREAFGSHPEAARIEHELAILRMDQGQLDEAQTLATSAYDHRKSEFGGLHDDTLETRNLLALIASHKGQLDEALDHAQAAVDGRQAILPPDDPRTLEAKGTLGKVLVGLSRYEDAVVVIRETYDAQVRTLGETHPDTLISANDLGVVFRRMQRYEEALEWQVRAMEGLAEHFPAGSLDVVIPRINIARIQNRIGRFEDARDMASQAIEDGVPVLGEDHYVIAVARLSRGRALFQLGERAEAKAHFEAAYEVLLDTLGPENPHTRNAEAALQRVKTSE